MHAGNYTLIISSESDSNLLTERVHPSVDRPLVSQKEEKLFKYKPRNHMKPLKKCGEERLVCISLQSVWTFMPVTIKLTQTHAPAARRSRNYSVFLPIIREPPLMKRIHRSGCLQIASEHIRSRWVLECMLLLWKFKWPLQHPRGSF